MGIVIGRYKSKFNGQEIDDGIEYGVRVTQQTFSSAQKQQARGNIAAQETLVVGTNLDNTPKDNSNNPVTSGGVKTALDGKADKLPMTGAGAATENNLMAIDDNGNPKDSGIPMGNVMEKDGYSEGLHAGLADNIVGEFSDEAEVSFRPTAGAVDIESGKADKGAKITGIKGNTRAWNQLVKWNLNDYSTGTDGDFTISIEDNAVKITCNASGYETNTAARAATHNYTANYIGGHKYLFRVLFKTLNAYCRISVGTDGSEPILQSSSWAVNNVIGTWITSGSSESGMPFVCIANCENGGSIWFKDLMAFDLTLICGSGNEPSTLAEFEADYQRWFGKPLSYEAYDAGSLRPVKMTGLKTTGFNQWSGIETQSGSTYYNGYTDSDSVESAKRILKFLTSGHDLYYHADVTGNYSGVPIGHIKFFSGSTEIFAFNPNGIISASSAAGITEDQISSINTVVIYGSTNSYTLSNICISLSHSGDRDGEYEPYWSSLLNVPITTMKGKLNGQGNSVVVFHDGLKKAGTVYDEIVRRGYKTYAIKRIGSTDLGTLTWNSAIRQDNTVMYSSALAGLVKAPTSDWVAANAVCQQFEVYSNNFSEANGIGLSINTAGYIFIFSDYTSVADFKAAMNGVMLYYELATPEEYLLDDFELPQIYDVDDYGTEEVQLGTGGIAPVLDIKYGINAPDTIKNLPHSYVSAVGEQNFTLAQQERARKNIGAASTIDVMKLQKEIDVISKKTESDYWVDMGLPSGVLWAKRNIFTGTGNDRGFAPSEYTYDASFFSWGNTEGHNPISSNSFDYNFGSSNDGSYASTDGAKLTGNIPLSQDAARYNCGEPWRMPSKTEFQELLNNCDFIDASGNVIASTTTDKLITMNSVVGIRLKSKINGKILFFPCSGNGIVTSLSGRGSMGYCWSSSLHTSTNGLNLLFHSSSVNYQDSSTRFYGFPIRPVM